MGEAFESAAASHVGCVRTRNEDACLVLDDRAVWAVADGMGGLAAGDVAAATIIDALTAAFRDGTPDAGVDACIARATRALQAAHAALLAEAAERGARIGSTVVVCLAAAGRLACVWSGDSRCYRYRDRRLDLMSRDHSQVQELVDLGLLSEAAARHHPGAHIVTRAIGIGAAVEVACCQADLRPGDRILLCSDGLNGMVEDDDIAAALGAAAAPEAVCERLVDLALQGGGLDNVTVVVVDCR